MSISIDSIVTDDAKNDNLTAFGKAVLIDRYYIWYFISFFNVFVWFSFFGNIFGILFES